MAQISPRLPLNKCKYLIILDYPNEEEHAYTKILRGPISKILTDSLDRAGISQDDCAFHIFLPRVKSNPVWPTYFEKGTTLRPEYRTCLSTLDKLVADNPDALVIPLGAFALWPFSQSTKIKDYRGYLFRDTSRNAWVLPSYSPNSIIKEYSLRAFLLQDLQKARRYVEEYNLSPSYKFPRRTVHIMETPGEAAATFQHLRKFPHVAVDIETFMDIQQISTISFSPDPNTSYVLPLLTRGVDGYNLYSPEDEQLIWQHLFEFLTDPTVGKIFHNAVFDLSHLWNAGIPTRGIIDDTMVMAHSLQPELPKSLAILGSTLCEVPQWKDMRVRRKDEEKVED